MAEYEINLENLVKMKRVFEEADEDGSGELDPDEFYEKLGPYLGQELNPASVSQLFMRIDADCGGTIDWQEFINYFFLQRASAADAGNLEDWRLHAQDHWRKEFRGAGHKEAVEHIFNCEQLGQYITAGRGGVLRVWSADSLSPVQMLANGTGWITGCTYMECPSYKRLVVAAQDRTFTFYEPVRSTFEYSSRLSCPGTMGPPLCLGELEREPGGASNPRLVWGDTEGSVMLLKADPPPLHADRQLVAKKDFEVLHAAHTDWVTHVQHIPGSGLVSSSLDSTLRIMDLERGVLATTVGVHKKGVRTFAYSSAFSVVASGGVERSVLLWQPKGNVNKPVGELPGHSSGVSQLVVADSQSQVITLSADHVVRLWDLRNHKCVQTITRTEWLRPEDNKPTAMMYDKARRRLLCASHKPVAWAHRRVEVERQHDARLVAALYNQTFSVVVSGDEGGTICMWNVQSGRREGGFSLHAKPAGAGSASSRSRSGSGGNAAMLAPVAPPKLTAMAFDANQRRLLVGLDKGLVRVYNFNSGAVLREFLSRESKQELTAVAFVPRQQQGAGPEQEEQQEGAASRGSSEAAGEGGDGQAQAEAEGEGGQRQGCPADHGLAAGFQSAGGCSDLSEHELLLRQQQGQQPERQQQQQQQQQERAETPRRQGTPSSGTASKPSTSGASEIANLVLATGWGRSLCLWEEGEEARISRCRQLAGHDADVLCMALLGRNIAATGDFEGEVRVWHLPSGACVATARFEGPEFERAVRRLCWLPTGGDGSGAPIGPRTPRTAASSQMLLVAGDNGSLQFWQVALGSASADTASARTPAEAVRTPPPPPAACRLVASVAATHRRQDCLTCLLLDTPKEGSYSQLWTGDSSGHVALWDLSPLLTACQSQVHLAEARPAHGAADLQAAPAGRDRAAAPPMLPLGSAMPRRLVHWRAAGASIVSLELLRAAGQGLVLVGGQDAAMGIWTRQGGLVGIFGKHTWDIEQPATWRDAAAAAVPPLLPVNAHETGLTPREVIANTPRRRNWVGSGSVTARQEAASSGLNTARSGSLTARRPGTAGGAVAAQSGRPATARAVDAQSGGAGGTVPSRPLTSASRPGSAGPPQTARGIVEEAHERQAALVAKLQELQVQVQGPHLERRSTPSPRGVPVTTTVFRLSTEAEAGGGAEPYEAPAQPALAAGSAVRQFLSPESAGARLGALAAEAAANKADRWSLPVYVQAHSALALQHMDDVPADTAGMWAQVKAQATEGERDRRPRAGSTAAVSPAAGGGGRKRSATPIHGVSIAAIVGRAPTAFGQPLSQQQQRP